MDAARVAQSPHVPRLRGAAFFVGTASGPNGRKEDAYGGLLNAGAVSIGDPDRERVIIAQKAAGASPHADWRSTPTSWRHRTREQSRSAACRGHGYSERSSANGARHSSTCDYAWSCAVCWGRCPGGARPRPPALLAERGSAHASSPQPTQAYIDHHVPVSRRQGAIVV